MFAGLVRSPGQSRKAFLHSYIKQAISSMGGANSLGYCHFKCTMKSESGCDTVAKSLSIFCALIFQLSQSKDTYLIVVTYYLSAPRFSDKVLESTESLITSIENSLCIKSVSVPAL